MVTLLSTAIFCSSSSDSASSVGTQSVCGVVTAVSVRSASKLQDVDTGLWLEELASPYWELVCRPSGWCC